MQPAIFQRFLCLTRHLIISLHDTCTFYQDLSILKSDFHILKWSSDGTRLIVFRCIIADDRRAFRHTVAFQYLYTVLCKTVNIVRIQMCPTGKNRVQFSTKYFFCKNSFRNRRISSRQSLINRLDHHWNHEHDIRFKNAHISDHMKQGVIDTEGRSLRKTFQPVHDKTECMMDWKYTEHGSSGFCRNFDCLNIGSQIILCQHNSLALSCRSGSKDNCRNIFCIRTGSIYFGIRS